MDELESGEQMLLPFDHDTGPIGPEGDGSHREAAEGGISRSQYLLAQHYRYGYAGVPKDLVQARVWYEAAGCNGDADAEWNADQLAKGMSAAETAEARFRIGTMYEQGGPVPRNRGMALDLYREAAESGNAGAQGALGRWHETGIEGLQASNIEAFAWYCVSARSDSKSSADARDRIRMRLTDQELSAAYCRLGQLYLDANEIPQDASEARHWYRLAAKDAVPEAEFAMGEIHYAGLGVAPDLHEALRWFLLAAQHGSVEAQVMVGTMRLDGEGAPRGAVDGLAWLQVAAVQGSAEAECRQRKAKRRMDEAQVKQAHSRARKYLALISGQRSAAAGRGPKSQAEPTET